MRLICSFWERGICKSGVRQRQLRFIFLKLGEENVPPSGGASTLDSRPAEADMWLALLIACNTKIKS